jgi:trehalose 6-phosphate synthase
MQPPRLAVVSNRLPAVIKRDENGKTTIQPASGGLVTALTPVLRDRGGVWIGWLGTPSGEPKENARFDDLLAQGAPERGFELKAVSLSPEDIEKYYFGFANEILWPLFHALPSRCHFEPSYWRAYEAVNRKFAAAIAQHTRETDYVWVQDYHLLLAARELKKSGARRQTGFFLHIPFPPLDLFLQVPWRFALLDALLEYDLIGFQTPRDRDNFLQCVNALVDRVQMRRDGQVLTITAEGRRVRVGAFPISIDFEGFERLGGSKAVAERARPVHESQPNKKMILGVDRLDYTKGIPARLLAFANTLTRYPELRKKVTLVQVVVPSRRQVQDYETLKDEVERLVGEINGRFTEVGWTPIEYIFRSLSQDELAAYYRSCQVALITPLKDGMNLVAKEYCASSVDEDSVLILSEFAGAAAQLAHGALLVNPHDIDGVAEAIHQALTMDSVETKARMRRLRDSIRTDDVFHWAKSYLEAGTLKAGALEPAAAVENEEFEEAPLLEPFVPAN